MPRELRVLIDDRTESYCYYHRTDGKPHIMSLQTFTKAVELVREKNMTLTVHYDEKEIPNPYRKVLHTVPHTFIVPMGVEAARKREVIRIAGVRDAEAMSESAGSRLPKAILRFLPEEIDALSGAVAKLMRRFARIETRLVDTHTCKDGDLRRYREQLDKIASIVFEELQSGRSPEVDVLTDMMAGVNHECGAGVTHLTLAPDGRLYICPGFYYDKALEMGDLGPIGSGVSIPDGRLLEREFSPLCKICDAGHCARCVYMNRLSTAEVNIPSEQQCVFSHTAREAGIELQKRLAAAGIKSTGKPVPTLDYCDPFTVVTRWKKTPPAQKADAPPLCREDGPRTPSAVLKDMDEKERLERLYVEYLENLRRIPCQMTWLDPFDVQIDGNEEYRINDDQLEGAVENPELIAGLEALHSGTYWPIFVYSRPQGFLIRDEEYRIRAFRSLSRHGIWKGKILAVTDQPLENGKSETTAYSIPAPALVSGDFKGRFSALYVSTDVDASGLDGSVRTRATDGYMVHVAWNLFLQKRFYEFAKRTGEMIGPAKVINEYNAWMAWRGY